MPGVSQFKQPSPGLTILVCFLPVSTILFMFTFNWAGYVSHMPLSAAISHSFFEAIVFNLVSRKIYLFFQWETQSFNLLKSQKLISANFLVSNKIQNIRQHYFKTNQVLSFDYALSFVAYCGPNWKVSVD